MLDDDTIQTTKALTTESLASEALTSATSIIAMPNNESLNSTLFQPLSDRQKRLIVDRTHYYVTQAKQIFAIKNSVFDINFNLKGRAAGMYRVKQHYFKRSREIRYNPYIFSRYFEDNLNTTVPHEVAHYVSDLLYNLKKIKPHGKEWQQIMFEFGADASVTAKYDLTGMPQKKLRYITYQCSCGDQQLSLIRHNKIKKRLCKYYCKVCKKTLQKKESVTI